MIPRRDLRRAVVVGAAALVLLSGLALVAMAQDVVVDPGTRVLGVDLGGLSRAGAEAALHRAFDARADEPVVLGRAISVAPAEIGLRLDVDASVGRAIRDPTPLLGDHDVAPAIRLDRERLAGVLRTYPGLDLDLDSAEREIRASWLTG